MDAASRIDSPWVDMRRASGAVGSAIGATKVRSRSPKFRIARAVAPMFPAKCGCTKTTRQLASMFHLRTQRPAHGITGLNDIEFLPSKRRVIYLNLAESAPLRTNFDTLSWGQNRLATHTHHPASWLVLLRMASINYDRQPPKSILL